MKINKSFDVRILAIVFTMALVTASAFAQGQVIYNSIPNPLPGNLPSQPFQAQGTGEFGDRVQFLADSGRSLLTATQTMSSWGCESGHWTTTCTTTPGATFSHPITLNIYSVVAGNQVGPQIGSVTQTFNIPYRPSTSAICGDGRWFNGTSCFNGFATNIIFNLGGLVVPNEVIYGIEFDTTTFGYNPIGPTACSGTTEGCGYDSLNVAVRGTQSVGTNPSPTDVYHYTFFGGCSGAVMPFGLDAGCWGTFKPVPVRFTAANAPTNANQCKNGGWQTRTRPDGTSFKNQGDCIQYVNTGR